MKPKAFLFPLSRNCKFLRIIEVAGGRGKVSNLFGKDLVKIVDFITFTRYMLNSYPNISK